MDRQAYLLHQVHAVTLATDIGAGIVSGWLMWQRRVPAALLQRIPFRPGRDGRRAP